MNLAEAINIQAPYNFERLLYWTVGERPFTEHIFNMYLSISIWWNIWKNLFRSFRVRFKGVKSFNGRFWRKWKTRHTKGTNRRSFFFKFFYKLLKPVSNKTIWFIGQVLEKILIFRMYWRNFRKICWLFRLLMLSCWMLRENLRKIMTILCALTVL